MWECCLNIKKENEKIFERIFTNTSQFIENEQGVVTINEENGYIKILLAVKNYFSERAKVFLTDVITETICNDFKEKFLNNSLILRGLDEIGTSAFKKALLNFDRETDKFMVKKNLVISKDIYLESFFNFKLKNLQNKWQELVALSNENREFLLSSESFVDLLKFLVDNLDICQDEISIVKEEGGYKIFSAGRSLSPNLINEESILSSVIDLSPQKINLYFSETSRAISLMQKIFEERITINKSLNVEKMISRL